jgi:hypothetical protein
MYRPQLPAAFLAAAMSTMAAAQPEPHRTATIPDTAPPRTDHAVGYYDAGLRRVVLIGNAGDPIDGERDKVWSWSGTRWEVITEAGPPGRTNAGAAYDVRRGIAVVAGGARKSTGSTWSIVGDSWEGDRTKWRRIGDIPPRDHQSLVEDAIGAVMMFGGIPADRSAPWPSDTWQLRSDGWSRVAAAGPPGRGRTALAFDRARGQVVLFGGASSPSGPDSAQTFFGDTWIWERNAWRKAAEGGPRGRYAHAMVFDERAGVVLLYSGAGAHRNAPLSDMWKWDGRRWTEIPLSGPTPGHRYQPVMVYDRARDRTVLYGGIGGPSDTWEWDGQGWKAIPKLGIAYRSTNRTRAVTGK